MYQNICGLFSLGQPTNMSGVLIIYMVSAKLDIHTSRKWDEYKGNLVDFPSFSEFYYFLRSRADILETAYSNNSRSDKQVGHYISKSFYSIQSM